MTSTDLHVTNRPARPGFSGADDINVGYYERPAWTGANAGGDEREVGS
jgi:hypothetical protein